jgi:hypothetical protein
MISIEVKKIFTVFAIIVICFGMLYGVTFLSACFMLNVLTNFNTNESTNNNLSNINEKTQIHEMSFDPDTILFLEENKLIYGMF